MDTHILTRGGGGDEYSHFNKRRGGGMDTHILTREVLMVGGMGNRCTMSEESSQ